MGDYDLLRLADLFVSRGQADVAERLVGERAPGSRDIRLLTWLKERAELRGDLGEALCLAETLFWHAPSLQAYRRMRDLAQSTGRWDEVRMTTLTHLSEQEHHSLLTEIHLDEGEIDQALEALGRVRTSPWGWGGGDLAIRVAEAAEEDRPRQAMRIYRERVDKLIAARGRGNYTTAAAYLARIRELYRRLGEVGAWEALIADLRERNRRLRALKEELQRAGL